MYFVSFYTDGQSDECLDLRNIKRNVEKSLFPFFEKMYIFNKESLKLLPNSDWVCNYYEEETDFKNGNKLGYFDFKPFLINYVLSLIPEGELLIWHDINFDKYTSYWQTDWVNLESISNRLLQDNKSDYWLRYELSNCYVKNFVKNYTVDYFFSDPIENSVVKNSLLLNCGQIIMRNTDNTKTLINEWMEYSKNKDLLSVSPNPYPHPESKLRGCQEQDILNCLIYKRILSRELNSNFPMYNFHWRSLRNDNCYLMENKSIIEYLNHQSS